jgi:NAD(P)-dependent dehydrogenase (short-subunit alcohol dehydrogenase family)
LAHDLLGLSESAALVTGAGRGAGQSIAIELARAGANVAVVDLQAAAAAETVAAVEREGARGVPIGADVSSEAGAAQAVAEAIAVLGPLRTGVNNVGNFGDHVPAPVVEHGWEFWQTAIDRNLRTTFFVSQALARHMIEARTPGAIVNIASLSGLRGAPNLAPYGAVKAGVMHLTQSLALELAPHGIRVNCVGPTAIEGPTLLESLPPESVEAMRVSIPLGRLCQPEDIGGAVVMLASDLARYVTGQTVMADGGVGCTSQRPSLRPGEARPRG